MPYARETWLLSHSAQKRKRQMKHQIPMSAEPNVYEEEDEKEEEEEDDDEDDNDDNNTPSCSSSRTQVGDL